jgi:hypothetical protein
MNFGFLKNTINMIRKKVENQTMSFCPKFPPIVDHITSPQGFESK